MGRVVGLLGMGLALVMLTSRLAAAQTWSPLSPANPPSDRRSCGAVTVDAAGSQRIFIFGGFGSGSGNNVSTRFRDDLLYYGTADADWHLSPATTSRPSLRDRHALGYDPLARLLVVFGGYAQSGPVINPTETYLGDTALYDPTGDQWSLPTVSVTRPTPRRDTRMHWSPQLGRLLLFGGQDGASRFNELWALAVNAESNTATWSLLTPSGTPPSPRNAACTAYDTDAGRLIIFGGETSDSVMIGDTVYYDVATNAWQTPTVGGDVPSARAYCAAEYDPVLGRMLLHGGQAGTDVVDGTYDFEPTTGIWTSFTIAPTPGAREVGGMAYSAGLGGMLSFGGRVGGVTYVADTWLFTAATCVPTAANDTTCDGVDDDCSGAADEDFVPSGTTCGTGLCASSGATSCSGGSVQDSCSAPVPGPPICCGDSDCDDGDGCTSDGCGPDLTCAHVASGCQAPDPCAGSQTACTSSILRLTRGAASPTATQSLDANERVILQLELTNGTLAAHLRGLRFLLEGDVPTRTALLWRVYDDADGDGEIDDPATPLAERPGPQTAMAYMDIDLAASTRRNLLITVQRTPVMADSGWLAPLMLAAALLDRRRRRLAFLCLVGLVGVEACGRSGFERHLGRLTLTAAMAEPSARDPTQHVIVIGVPLESAPIDL
ncbi:MAG: kelch repeat-containing protein [Myxococcota bacterium]|nr:kelch repeat-containing protein [Myxococcota bacterium]